MIAKYVAQDNIYFHLYYFDKTYRICILNENNVIIDDTATLYIFALNLLLLDKFNTINY